MPRIHARHPSEGWHQHVDANFRQSYIGVAKPRGAPMRMSLRIITAVAVAAFPSDAHAQAPVDAALARYINGIRAIDQHAHPMRPIPAGAPADSEFDALPLDGIPAFELPSRLKPENLIWREAQSALYRVDRSLTGNAYDAALEAAVADAHRANGERFPEWALDRAGIDVMLANRVAMGPGLAPPRFRWVAFADPLLLPLETRNEATRTPDTRPLYPREAKLLQRYLRDLKLTTLPATLDGYVRSVVDATIARQKAGGAVGIKFEAAYLRPLDFDDPDATAAARIYAQYVNKSSAPSRAEYKTLQDYLFRAIARAAGRNRLPIQIHVLETFGGYYSPRGSSPHLLEPAFNDSTLRATKFVIVHGGWPLVAETQAELSKPNVYADISMIDDILSPTVLAGVLRQWLGEWPEKVLFGSDAFDGGAEQGWEQVAWVGTTTARRALAIALTGMMNDGEISRARAEQLARMVLRENAMAVYGLR
jgi:predicted TIM-barrel fold metal-dependent hydrolase